MKQKFIICLLVFILLPFSIFASNIDGYKLFYSKLNEEQLYSQRLNNTEEIVLSSFAATGGTCSSRCGARLPDI